MKQFDPFQIDLTRCQNQLNLFKHLLDRFAPAQLRERKDVLSFFRASKDLSALAGYLSPEVVHVDRLAYEYDFWGDFAADRAVGDSEREAYCFIEFENAAPGSIFSKLPGRSAAEWASRFEKGYSQIIDWFWKLHDMRGTDAFLSRFGHVKRFHYFGLLVVGRSASLNDVESKRFNWRRDRVVVDSRHVRCMTYDELYDDLSLKLKTFLECSASKSEAGIRTKPAKRKPAGKTRKTGSK
jgi:Domain of unknown function (DUF4263)